MNLPTLIKIADRSVQAFLAACGLCAYLFFPLNAHAQDGDEKVIKVWVDSPISLPAAPMAENLLRFYSNQNQSFFIDSKSISIAADGSLRYTLVSSSQAGAKNVSYEGLRCDTNQKRLFAFGRADGSWSNSRRNEWDNFDNTGVNKHHSTLAWDFVCEGGSIAGKVDKIIQRIRQNQSLRQFH
jgi:hypothetical protein